MCVFPHALGGLLESHRPHGRTRLGVEFEEVPPDLHALRKTIAWAFYLDVGVSGPRSGPKTGKRQSATKDQPALGDWVGDSRGPRLGKNTTPGAKKYQNCQNLQMLAVVVASEGPAWLSMWLPGGGAMSEKRGRRTISGEE